MHAYIDASKFIDYVQRYATKQAAEEAANGAGEDSEEEEEESESEEESDDEDEATGDSESFTPNAYVSLIEGRCLCLCLSIVEL